MFVLYTEYAEIMTSVFSYLIAFIFNNIREYVCAVMESSMHCSAFNHPKSLLRNSGNTRNVENLTFEFGENFDVIEKHRFHFGN